MWVGKWSVITPTIGKNTIGKNGIEFFTAIAKWGFYFVWIQGCRNRSGMVALFILILSSIIGLSTQDVFFVSEILHLRIPNQNQVPHEKSTQIPFSTTDLNCSKH